MNQFNKDIIAALSSDKDITLNEVLRRQIEVAANQFLQNELTAVLGYEPHIRIDRSKDDVNYHPTRLAIRCAIPSLVKATVNRFTNLRMRIT